MSPAFVVVEAAAGGKAEAFGGIGLPLPERRPSPPVIAPALHAGNPTLEAPGESRAI